MPVLKTESRFPAGFAPEQLGQAAIRMLGVDETFNELGDAAPSGIAFALVSYLTSPLTLNSANQYVVFVPHGPIATAVVSYRWEIDQVVDIGLVAVPLLRSPSDEGVLEWTPSHTGEVLVTVRLMASTGQELGHVTMRQTVVPFSPLFESFVASLSETIARWKSEWRPSIDIGNATTTGELASDLYPYILSAVAQPIDGKPNPIPWQLLAGIAYREMFFSPKAGLGPFPPHKPNRSVELSWYRSYLNGTTFGRTIEWKVSDSSLGLCQMQPHTLATVALDPARNRPYTNFLEEDKLKQDRALQDAARFAAYLALPVELASTSSTCCVFRSPACGCATCICRS